MKTVAHCEYPSSPVHRVQTMLRTLSYVHHNIPHLTTDGCFGAVTLRAVKAFQADAGLPVSGSVDRVTWDIMTEEYIRVSEELTPRKRPPIFTPIPGQESNTAPHVYMAQRMFFALSNVLDEIQTVAPTGVLDDATKENIRWLQRYAALEETADLNPATWEALCRLFWILLPHPNLFSYGK